MVWASTNPLSNIAGNLIIRTKGYRSKVFGRDFGEQKEYAMIETANNEHEKIFDEICDQFQLVQQSQETHKNQFEPNFFFPVNQETQPQPIPESQIPAQVNHYQRDFNLPPSEVPTLDSANISTTDGSGLQLQMKKFQSELKETQDELIEKIKSLENVNFTPSMMNEQVKAIADQLNAERLNNTKLSADLAKSLELCLQLQLEIQGLKAKMIQTQTEEKKYSNSLVEKNKQLQRDLQLSIALKEEIGTELEKAKSAFEHDRDQLNKQINELKDEKQFLEQANEELHETIYLKEQEIHGLNERLGNISEQFNEVEESASQQNDVLKNLMEVAEAKIVELKLALDKKSLESQDLFNQVHQLSSQTQVLRQENAALKDYVTKLNYYQQQMQMMQQQSLHGNA